MWKIMMLRNLLSRSRIIFTILGMRIVGILSARLRLSYLSLIVKREVESYVCCLLSFFMFKYNRSKVSMLRWYKFSECLIRKLLNRASVPIKTRKCSSSSLLHCCQRQGQVWRLPSHPRWWWLSPDFDCIFDFCIQNFHFCLYENIIRKSVWRCWLVRREEEVGWCFSRLPALLLQHHHKIRSSFQRLEAWLVPASPHFL